MAQDAWSIMAEMSHYIRDADPNLDAYDADVVFTKSLSGKYVKNGIGYFLDVGDFGLFCSM